MATVLVVGPKTVKPKVVAQLVREIGHETREAASPEVAKQILRSERVAVLIAELRSDSLDLLRTAKMVSRCTRVILLSANASASDYKSALKEGALEVLVKPFGTDDLQATLRRAFDTTEGAKSIIHELSLTDLLQIMHMGRRSVTVKVTPGEGRIHLSCGEIVHATHYDLSGTAALRSMLATEATTVETAPASDVVESIEAPFEMLLLDLMREIDEQRRDEDDIVIEEAEVEPEAQVMSPAPVERGSSFAATFMIAMALIALLIAVGEMHRLDLPKIAQLNSSVSGNQ